MSAGRRVAIIGVAVSGRLCSGDQRRGLDLSRSPVDTDGLWLVLAFPVCPLARALPLRGVVYQSIISPQGETHEPPHYSEIIGVGVEFPLSRTSLPDPFDRILL